MKKNKIILTFILVTIISYWYLIINNQQQIACHAIVTTEIETENDSTASGTIMDQAASDSSTTSTLKERIEKVIDERNGSIQGTIDELQQNKKGLVGEIIRVSEETITIMDYEGTNKVIPINNSKVILMKKNKVIEINDLAVGEWVVIIGFEDEQEDFIPQVIEVSSRDLSPIEYLVHTGTINSLSSRQLILNPFQQESPLTFKLGLKTQYLDYRNNESKRIEFEADIKAIVAGYKDDDDNIATFVKARTQFSSN